MKRTLTLVLVAVMTMTALLSIPASAAFIWETNFNKPNCGCSNPFSAHYSGGITPEAPERATATADVTHTCEEARAYVSIKCWIAPWSNLNNYTSRTFTASDTGVNSAFVDKTQDYTDTVYALLGVENYYEVSVKHNGTTYISQARTNDGDIPLSYTPPVVTQ